MKTKTKISSIQELRGISALMVVMCHFGAELKNYPILKKILHRGENGVQIFFFISGYIIIYSLISNRYTIQSFFRFLIKRSLRIDPPYFVSIILLLVTFAFFQNDLSLNNSAFRLNYQQFIAHILYYLPFTSYPFYSHIYWTLCIEFQFYILVGLLYFLSNNIVYKSAFIFLFAICQSIPVLNSYYFVTNYGAIFGAGMALMHFNEKKNQIFLFNILVCLIIIYLRSGIVIAGMLLIAGLIINFKVSIFKPLNFLGEISYSLYITHIIVLFYFTGFLNIIDKNRSYELAYMLLEVSLSIVFSYLFYLIFEKPSIALSKRISIFK